MGPRAGTPLLDQELQFIGQGGQDRVNVVQVDSMLVHRYDCITWRMEKRRQSKTSAYRYRCTCMCGGREGEREERGEERGGIRERGEGGEEREGRRGGEGRREGGEPSPPLPREEKEGGGGRGREEGERGKKYIHTTCRNHAMPSQIDSLSLIDKHNQWQKFLILVMQVFGYTI